MKKITLVIPVIFMLWNCNQDNEPVPPRSGNNTYGSSSWTIPVNEVFDGGPGKDGIPSLLNPEMISASSATYLSDDALVIGYKNGDDIRAYPHAILDWHEIINDEINEHPVAITYCPLTGTGIGWEREINGEITTFGVSGLLYNSNLIPYDRLTDSNWSQMLLESVNGQLVREEVSTFQVIETTWKTWKKWYPQTRVNSTNTGFQRDYERYPYGNYKDNDLLIFPVANEDDRLHPKKRVLGVITENTAKAYQFESFPEPSLIEDELSGKKIIVVGSKTDNYLFAYHSETENGQILNLALEIEDEIPVLKDGQGNVWNVFGEAISGPLFGEKLKKTKSYIGFWFAWAAFYPQIEIY